MEENEELNNIITLNDENGEEVQFEFLDLIEYNEHKQELDATSSSLSANEGASSQITDVEISPPALELFGR